MSHLSIVPIMYRHLALGHCFAFVFATIQGYKERELWTRKYNLDFDDKGSFLDLLHLES